MTKLFRSDIEVARVAQVARVLVVVTATKREGIDMVDDSGDPRTACRGAALTQAVGAT